MSKAKDFDSNFVSGAYEVNKERDKRRNRRMQNIKHKKEAEKLAKSDWHGGYYWKDEKRVGVGVHIMIIQPRREIKDYKKVEIYDKESGKVIIRLVPNGSHIAPPLRRRIKEYEYVPVEKPYACKDYGNTGKKFWKRLSNKRERQAVRRYIDNECYVYDELTIGTEEYLSSVDWHFMKK